MALKRICQKAGCSNFRLEGHSYCQAHVHLEIREPADYSKWTRSSDLYHTKRWLKASREFLKANPECVVCGLPAKVTDHIIPHRGDENLFWDPANWQPLCLECHRLKTKREIAYRQSQRH